METPRTYRPLRLLRPHLLEGSHLARDLSLVLRQDYDRHLLIRCRAHPSTATRMASMEACCQQNPSQNRLISLPHQLRHRRPFQFLPQQSSHWQLLGDPLATPVPGYQTFVLDQHVNLSSTKAASCQCAHLRERSNLGQELHLQLRRILPTVHAILLGGVTLAKMAHDNLDLGNQRHLHELH